MLSLYYLQVVSVETGGGLDKGQDGEIWVRGPIVMKGED